MFRKQVLMNSDRKERQQKILLYGLNAMGIQYSAMQSQKVIDIQCVLRMLDDFCQYLKSSQYPSATNQLSQLEKYITEAFLPQQWEDQSIKRKTTSIIEEFKKIVDEIKQSRDQKTKLELLIKRNHDELFQQNRNIEQNKTALIKLLANNELQLALKLTQNVKELHPISDLIQKIRQYNFITDRHIALTIGLNKHNMSWTLQNINFNQLRVSLKSFIDQQYRRSQDLYGKMMTIKQIMRTTRQIPQQMERQNFQFNTQFLKDLIQQKYQQYQLMKWVQIIQQLFIKYQIFQDDYQTNKRSTKFQLLKENVVNIISFYQQNKNNPKSFNLDLKEQPSKITLLTARSSLASIDFDTNQQLLDVIMYREKSFKDYLEDNQVLNQKLQNSQQTLKKLQANIKKMEQQIANLTMLNENISAKNCQIQAQNKRLQWKLYNKSLDQQIFQKFLSQKDKILKQFKLKLNEQQQKLKVDNQKMKQKITNLVRQNKELSVKNVQRQAYNKELLKKIQTRRLDQQEYQKYLSQKNKYQQQLSRKKSILRLRDFIQRYKAIKEYQQSQRFGQFNSVSLSRTDNIHSYEQEFNLAKSNIIKEQFGQLDKILNKQIPHLSFKNFRRVFIHESKHIQLIKQINKQLLRSIQGKKHLLFIIKLVQKSKIIIIYIQKQILEENKLKNFARSEISMIKKSVEQRSNKSENQIKKCISSIQYINQYQVSNTFQIQRSISQAQSQNESENNKQEDNGFIITLWNKNKFIPKKPVRLLKFNDKKQLLFGEKDLIINIESGQISSYIGLADNKVFSYMGPQKKKLIAWAQSKFKIQQMQIFYQEQTNYIQKKLRQP